VLASIAQLNTSKWYESEAGETAEQSPTSEDVSGEMHRLTDQQRQERIGETQKQVVQNCC